MRLLMTETWNPWTVRYLYIYFYSKQKPIYLICFDVFFSITSYTGHQIQYKKGKLIRTPAVVSSPYNPIYLIVFNFVFIPVNHRLDWLDVEWEELIQIVIFAASEGLWVLAETVLITVTHNPRPIHNQLALQEVTSVIKFSETAATTPSCHSPCDVLCNVR